VSKLAWGREAIRKATTVAGCIEVHEESIDRMKVCSRDSHSDKSYLKQTWDSALESLQKALDLTKQEENLIVKKINAERISQLASQYSERANFVKLSRRAKKVANEETK
jgi:hypothetical protein